MENRGNRIVVVLDGGEVSQIISDNFDAEVLLVNGDDPEMTRRPKVRVDSIVVDEYFDHCSGYVG